MSNVVTLSMRRAAATSEKGFEYHCAICDHTIVTAIRHDHFPSCLMCRSLCLMSKLEDMRAESERA